MPVLQSLVVRSSTAAATVSPLWTHPPLSLLPYTHLLGDNRVPCFHRVPCSLCIWKGLTTFLLLLAACHVEQRRGGLPHKPSLIVCPPTLVGHWPHEIVKFVGEELLSVVQVCPVPFLFCLQTKVFSCREQLCLASAHIRGSHLIDG